MPVPAIDAQSLENDRRSTGEHLKGSTKKFQTLQLSVTFVGAQLKCPYANAHSKGNKQKTLKTGAHLQGYDLIGITETW